MTAERNPSDEAAPFFRLTAASIGGHRRAAIEDLFSKQERAALKKTSASRTMMFPTILTHCFYDAFCDFW